MAGKKKRSRSRNGLSRAEWERLVAEYEHGEETRQAFCVERGVSVSSLDYWRRKLREEQAPGFIELGSMSAGGAVTWDIELELGGGVMLRFRRG
ncbi:MAG: IS66 family insertion sequence element accessory protein TnpA [bacterium]